MFGILNIPQAGEVCQAFFMASLQAVFGRQPGDVLAQFWAVFHLTYPNFGPIIGISISILSFSGGIKMRAIEHLSPQEREDLLVMYAKILGSFPDSHIDPVSKDFNKRLIEGARYLAPFIYSGKEPEE
jgi:hypothetical protein